jgi:hypothetical protein
MNLPPLRIAPSARVIAGFYLMAAFWPHRMEKGEKGGQNVAIELLEDFPEPLQTAHFKGVIRVCRQVVVLS